MNNLFFLVGTLEESLKLSPDEFKSKFGREKPKPENEVIFHCKMGGRAARASLVAESLGFVKYVLMPVSLWQIYFLNLFSVQSRIKVRGLNGQKRKDSKTA